MEQTFSRFYTPQFVTGRGSISFISTLGKKRIGIVRGGRSYSPELEKVIEAIAEETQALVCCFAKIRNEPNIQDIFQCMETVRDFEPDMILAVGGGSVLDTAKAIHLFYENPEMSFEDSLTPFTLPALGKKAVHVSVPTTSGTGSEATSVAVFIDSENQIKKLLMDHNLIPHYAILDANLTDSLPDSIRIATAFDALTHAIESSTAANASCMTQAIALEAAVDILENLPLAVSTNTDTKSLSLSRERLHVASALAGCAITNSCTGIAHSYDHPGPAFGYAHGKVCGLMLPYTIGLCKAHPSYEAISRRLGYTGTAQELTQALTEHLFTLMKELSVDTSFQTLGIDEHEYFKRVPVWSEISLNAFATMVSPAKMTYEKGLQLYDACYYGKHPTL